jgi:hypothetical protein
LICLGLSCLPTGTNFNDRYEPASDLPSSPVSARLRARLDGLTLCAQSNVSYDVDHFTVSRENFCANTFSYDSSIYTIFRVQSTLPVNITVLRGTMDYSSIYLPGYYFVLAWSDSDDILISVTPSFPANGLFIRYSASVSCGPPQSPNDYDMSVDFGPVVQDPSPPVVQLGTHFYRLVPRLVTHAEAVQLAAADTYLNMSGHLVTVTSAQENAFLLSYLQNFTLSSAVWMGASNNFSGARDVVQWVGGPELRVPLLYFRVDFS